MFLCSNLSVLAKIFVSVFGIMIFTFYIKIQENVAVDFYQNKEIHERSISEIRFKNILTLTLGVKNY